MHIAIVHLTDIHFTKKSNFDTKMHPFCQAIISVARGLKKIYFVISGDIAFAGKGDEFEVAKKFLSVSKLLLSQECKDAEFKYIIVPGNHDCNVVELDTQLRRNAILNMNYETLGNDNSVIDECLKVQSSFWDFYQNYNPLPIDKLLYKVEDIIEGKKIIFNCINTAWMSQKHEKVGSFFFPVKHYNEIGIGSDALTFGVWHHPYNWFNPSTNENNKKEFEVFTESLSTTHFFGHEHQQSQYDIENKNLGNRINLLSGDLFNEDEKPNISGFQILLTDVNTNKGVLKKYNLSGDIYQSSEKEIIFGKEIKRKFKLKDAFQTEIQSIKIPLIIDDKKSIKLSEIFVFPDLDSDKNESRDFDNYINSKMLLNNDFGNCIIDGESQIGKSALLSQVCLNLYENGDFPILLKGKDFKEPNLEKIIKRAFKSQYEEQEDYEVFFQSPIEKLALLIDDYQDCDFNSTTTKKLFDEAAIRFNKVIIALDSASSLLPSMKAEFNEFKFYEIKPLGYKKRNDLIENYHHLKSDATRIQEQDKLNAVKSSLDNVQSILGDKLMPSYPVFILAILQALEYKPLNQNETSFGYCYQSLIHYSLFKSGISKDDIDTYFNFLTELAFDYIIKEKESISKSELLEFYVKYQNKFIVPSYEKVLTNLKNSKILTEDDSNIKFGYKYILYYLSAKKISDVLHTKQGKEIINNLFNKVHIERNASILVFVTHHSKDISFIEQSILYSMIVLEGNPSITLEKMDPFSKKIEEFSAQLINNVLETNRNPKIERDKVLLEQDKRDTIIERNKDYTISDTVKEMNEVVVPFLQSFRSIEIIGQIIKNRKGSLEKSQLSQMIKEVYTTGFRTIAYMGDLLELSKEDIIQVISEETNATDNKFQIERKINQFVHMNNMQVCLGVFTKLMHSVGIKELKNIYVEVANEMNSPAAKLVSFSINSYYGSISETELISLSNEFKDNIVALRILRARVKSYVYNRNLDFKTKQKFASILNMTLKASKPMAMKN